MSVNVVNISCYPNITLYPFLQFSWCILFHVAFQQHLLLSDRIVC